MVEWSYIQPHKSTYQFQQGSAVENVSIWSLNLPSSMQLVVRFSAIFPALWPLTWHKNYAKWVSSYFIQLSVIYFKWRQKVILTEKTHGPSARMTKWWNTVNIASDRKPEWSRLLEVQAKPGIRHQLHTHTHTHNFPNFATCNISHMPHSLHTMHKLFIYPIYLYGIALYSSKINFYITSCHMDITPLLTAIWGALGSSSQTR